MALVIAACGTSKSVTAPAASPAPQPPKTSVTGNNVAFAFPEVTTLNASKCKLTLSMNDRTFPTVTVSVKVVRDTLIQLSVMPFLGIEMYRVELTPDSVFIIDKNNKNYFATGYDFMKQRFGITVGFGDVQSLLLNRTLGQTPVVKPADLQKTDSGFQLKSTYNGMGAVYSFSNDYRLKQTDLERDGDHFSCVYDNLQNYENTQFPSHCTISAEVRQKHAVMEFSFDKMILNGALHLTPLNRSRYTKVAFDQILPF
jgi:hypothetical protein